MQSNASSIDGFSPTATSSIPFVPPGLNPFALLLHIITHPKIRDWLQLAALGLIAEGTRRISTHVWAFLEQVQDPSWIKKCRSFECETTRMAAGQRKYPWLTRKESKKTNVDALDRRAPAEPHLIPSFETSHWIVYNGALVRFWRRDKKMTRLNWDKGKLQVSILGFRGRDTFRMLMNESKARYADTDVDRLLVSVIDEKGEGAWRQLGTRHKRRLETVVCEEGVAERICDEIEEFLSSEKWYESRGIPWRRGYLLEGVPGSGKTSLIHAIASHLDLSLYMVSLASSGLTDSKLARCMTNVPAGAIVVMEDIDISMPDRNGSLRRDELDADAPYDDPPDGPEDEKDRKRDKEKDNKCISLPGKSAVTLSGLFNAIDGVAGSEGRILFMTTNVKDRLDEALIRPGRADVCFEFQNASRYQAEKLFRVFYPTSGPFSITAARRLDATSLEREKPTPNLDADGILELSKRFGSGISDRAFSTADLQCYLLQHKMWPGDAVDSLPAWVAGKQAEQAREMQRREDEAEARTAKRNQKLQRKKKPLANAAGVDETKSDSVGQASEDASFPQYAPVEIVLEGVPMSR